ncbi:sensor histidine kinase [Tardiphaga sp. 42S5]|uniref:sensor histidine kinase n=1 Tax=Tardiphaga sp. 42S5 TaxID=1404799 RepID=UPI002A5ABE44|nr:ATP-binding protein [Tardiphaga sp. 42S5]WPO42881.1 ATP-binding protein [Tardiphaga sp. 42S5]
MVTRARVMVVEDDRIVARDISEQLGRIGHSVIGVTARGEAAIELAINNRPDLVLMDIRLEGEIDGIDAARQIRARCQTPVVFLTAYADDETVRRASQAEPFGYLLKPFEDLQLRTVIEMALYKDRADRKLRESAAALQVAQAELARMSRITTMGQLTASIAHEVNQPLMAVVMNAEACVQWLKGEKANVGEARAAAERAIAEGHRAGAIIERVRAIARNAPVVFEVLDLNEMIEGVLSIVQPELSRQELALDVYLQPGQPLIVGDRVQLQQVMLNLVSNAADAINASETQQRRVTVASAMDPSGEVCVTVEDAGAGIDPDHLDMIFNPFFTTKQDGIGMGLSICRSIIDAHGGRLWAEPRVPTGTRFRFTLPRRSLQVAS